VRPIVLFLPARDEAASVGDVLRRTPAHLLGHDVLRVVVDDGSRDTTAVEARAAGAQVVPLGGHGLGAAVRVGLQAALALDPVAIAFCDADGEYAPEELPRLVAPILDGRADYVVGSRFSGEVKRMHRRRRVGNRFLTALLACLARVPITDGQSGYRALSPAAARAANIIHDYNYAQVLTLDLLAKGFRYDEVPISYSFRERGTSFVRLPTYLRHVVPAVWRQLRTPASVFDNVGRELPARSRPDLRVDRAS
jgi:glycosyltransferase involved in cell wall biosynthesis